MSPTSKFSHLYPQIVTNITVTVKSDKSCVMKIQSDFGVSLKYLSWTRLSQCRGNCKNMRIQSNLGWWIIILYISHVFEVGSTNIFPNGINLYRLNELRSSNERDFVNVTDINAKFSLVIFQNKPGEHLLNIKLFLMAICVLSALSPQLNHLTFQL